MLSRVGSPFVVLEMGADEVMQFEPPPETTHQQQQQQQQQSPSKAAVRRRLSRFRSPGKQKHPGKAAGGSKGQGQAGSLRLLLGSGSGNGIGIGSSASGEKENVQLRELLVSQLDLIQRQSEDIVKKDRKLRELQRENEALRKRLTNIEFKEQKQKKPEDEENAENAQPLAFAEAEDAYFVLSGESHIRREREEVKQILSHAEVPGWRVKVVPPSYSQGSAQEELVDDDALLKRHNKPEVDEKRRKRWDIQRMREQRQVARLKARYEKSPRPGPTSRDRKKEWMEACDPLGITHIHVGESVPVVAWKAPMPVLAEEDFELPWNGQ